MDPAPRSEDQATPRGLAPDGASSVQTAGAARARRTPRARAVTRPRPGHADLAGVLKYDRDDARDILERASARETTARVAAGAVCRRLLREFGITVGSHLVHLGGIDARPSRADASRHQRGGRCVAAAHAGSATPSSG